MAERYRLKLTKLDFVSLVDQPAQPNATVLLFKSKDGVDSETVSANAQFLKADEELGLAFFWAFTSTNADGSDHYDLHRDTVDQDFIKAAMEWSLDGGAVDEMHDEKSSRARTVFAMPMTPEIAKAYGIETKRSGLMLAIKPTPVQMAKLKDGSYTGVSIGGQGIREVVKTAARTKKNQLRTTEVDGHVHLINTEGVLYSTSWANATGAEQGHSHDVVQAEDGSLELLANSGHTHEIEGEQPTVLVVTEGTVVVQSRAPKSTHRNSQPRVEPKMSNEHEKTIAELTKRAERLERLAKMSGAHKTHFDSLPQDDAESFLALTKDARESAIQAAVANDPVEVEFDGHTYRKSAGAAVLNIAKAAKAQAEVIAKQAAAIKKAAIRKEAAETIPNLPGSDEVHDMLLAAIDAFNATPEQKTAMKESLKGANAIAATKRTAPGFGGTDASTVDSDDPTDMLNDLAKDYASENKVPFAKAFAHVLSTPEGKALYALGDSTLPGESA